MSFLIWITTFSAAEQSFTIEPAGPPRSEIPAAMRECLELSGTRLLRTVNGIDIPLAEVWWFKDLTVGKVRPMKAAVFYRELRPGQLLAVLYLPRAMDDVAHHKIQPGFYTLRYAHRKSKDNRDEDDEPVSVSYGDYVVLSHIDYDNRALASSAIHSAHSFAREQSTDRRTAMLALPPLNPAYPQFPYPVSDDAGHCAVQFKVPARHRAHVGDLHIAIMLVNPPNTSKDD
jgi:hypothetical protein